MALLPVHRLDVSQRRPREAGGARERGPLTQLAGSLWAFSPRGLTGGRQGLSVHPSPRTNPTGGASVSQGQQERRGRDSKCGVSGSQQKWRSVSHANLPAGKEPGVSRNPSQHVEIARRRMATAFRGRLPNPSLSAVPRSPRRCPVTTCHRRWRRTYSPSDRWPHAPARVVRWGQVGTFCSCLPSLTYVAGFHEHVSTEVRGEAEAAPGWEPF